MAKTIVITSGKGGVGKTVAVSNIAVALSKLGKRVLMADIDIGLRNLDLAMGLNDIIVYDIIDVIEGKCSFDKAIFKLEKYGHLHLLPAAQSTDKDFLNPENFSKLFSEVEDNYDYILLDCPAGIEKGFKSAIAGADLAIVTLTPEMSSVRDADKVITLLEMASIPEIKILINRVRQDMIKRGDMLTIDEITDILGISPIGIIEEDEIVLKSQKRNTIAVLESSSKAGKQFRNVAKRITGENIPIVNLKKEKSFFKWFY
ncbi:MAG: septum site-determining protein MinD [Ruminococcaceae bacterium]|nr:septum site-determining protein MinD [Oscillospiraceae bacterium]